jgi:hypothetical protein
VFSEVIVPVLIIALCALVCLLIYVLAGFKATEQEHAGAASALDAWQEGDGHIVDEWLDRFDDGLEGLDGNEGPQVAELVRGVHAFDAPFREALETCPDSDLYECLHDMRRSAAMTLEAVAAGRTDDAQTNLADYRLGRECALERLGALINA